jgi:hypothetical protein
LKHTPFKSAFNLPTKYDCGNIFHSSEYINLELKASSSSYTAPVNGWIFLRFDCGSGTSFISIVNNDLIADQIIY